jgi:uncharacterized membrane protein
MVAAAHPIQAQPTELSAQETSARLASVDILRGIVIGLMALDHVRDFFHVDAFLFDPLDVDRTSPALFATRWITHFCAPVFVFLAGVSAFLQSSRLSRSGLARRLATRGLWLLLLEVTVIGFAWNFSFDFLFLQVIWAIGWSMLALAALIWLPASALLGLGVAILALHNLLDPVRPDQLGNWAPLWAALHESGPILLGGELRGFFAYPVLPWIGVICFGYGVGPIFRMEPARRRQMLKLIGASLIGLFVALRLADLHGEPNGWEYQADFGRTAMDWLSTTKYPPSLQFAAMTLGPALLLLALLERLKGAAAEPWLTFGAVPLFVYVLHIYIAHGLAVAIGAAQGYPLWGVGDLFRGGAANLQGWGFSLPVVYAIWLAVLAILYPPARWFARLKRRRSDWWLSYL